MQAVCGIRLFVYASVTLSTTRGQIVQQGRADGTAGEGEGKGQEVVDKVRWRDVVRGRELRERISSMVL